ncbi:MAG: hypothetical protein P1U40_07105 [Coxiellaceae bacterium]|nr:hypothetical protein [Coxiellaceae bacterium]
MPNHTLHRVASSTTAKYLSAHALASLVIHLIRISYEKRSPDGSQVDPFSSNHTAWATGIASLYFLSHPSAMSQTHRNVNFGLGMIPLVLTMVSTVVSNKHYPGEAFTGAFVGLTSAHLVQLFYRYVAHRNDPILPATAAAAHIVTDDDEWAAREGLTSPLLDPFTATDLEERNERAIPDDNDIAQLIRQQDYAPEPRSLAHTAIILFSTLSLSASNPGFVNMITVASFTVARIVAQKANGLPIHEGVAYKLPVIGSLIALAQHHRRQDGPCRYNGEPLWKRAPAELVMHYTEMTVAGLMLVANCIDLPFTMRHGWQQDHETGIFDHSGKETGIAYYVSVALAGTSLLIGLAQSVHEDCNRQRHSL